MRESLVPRPSVIGQLFLPPISPQLIDIFVRKKWCIFFRIRPTPRVNPPCGQTRSRERLAVSCGSCVVGGGGEKKQTLYSLLTKPPSQATKTETLTAKKRKKWRTCYLTCTRGMKSTKRSSRRRTALWSCDSDATRIQRA